MSRFLPREILYVQAHFTLNREQFGEVGRCGWNQLTLPSIDIQRMGIGMMITF